MYDTYIHFYSHHVFIFKFLLFLYARPSENQLYNLLLINFYCILMFNVTFTDKLLILNFYGCDGSDVTMLKYL